MNKLTAIGAISLVTGLALLVFKGISGFTGKAISLPDRTLEQTLDPAKLKWMEDLSDGFVLSCAEQIVTTPLYIYCIIIGAFLFVLGGILGNK